MQLKYICVEALFCLVIANNLYEVDTLEPVTTTLAVGTALLGSAFLVGYDKAKSLFFESCDTRWINLNQTGLEHALKSRLYGQHLVVRSVTRAIGAHWNNPNPSKALVLSFHGWTGGGKNYVSGMLADNLFQEGQESQFVHTIIGSHHFPHERYISRYQDQLRDWVRGNVTKCRKSLFIFDEMDKIPVGVLDVLKPFLDHHPKVDGIDYRKTVFIFLSNTAGTDITYKALQHWEEGRRREDITLKEMEEIINLAAFNEEGALRGSSLIDKHLVSVFVPFLPLEREHVKMCIRDDLERKGLQYQASEEFLNKVADELEYFPPGTMLYSKTGCKRVTEKVDMHVELTHPRDL